MQSGALKEGKDGSVLLSLHVQPRASKNAFSGIYNHAIKLRITSPPVEGKANAHVVSIAAKLFNVPKSAVYIIRGNQSRMKCLRIDGVTIDAAKCILSNAME